MTAPRRPHDPRIVGANLLAFRVPDWHEDAL